MNEPKKETVRIVLPPRRDGAPAAANPREAAMVNLPPKPLPTAQGAPPTMPAPPKPPGAPVVPPPPGIPRPAGAAPLPPKPVAAPPPMGAPPRPAAPSVPAPTAGIPTPPRPSMVPPPSAPRPPMPAAAPAPAAPKPAVAPPPSMADVAAKKETAKIQLPPPGRPAPQATVKIGPAAPAASPMPTLKRAEAAPVAEAAGGAPDKLIDILAIAAAVVALASLGVQVWMFL